MGPNLQLNFLYILFLLMTASVSYSHGIRSRSRISDGTADRRISRFPGYSVMEAVT
jgi:hypothetical protein